MNRQECKHCGGPIQPGPLQLSRALLGTAYGLILVGAFVWGGALLRLFLEGMQRSRLPYAGGLVPLLAAAIIAWLATQTFSIGVCAACGPRFPWRAPHPTVLDPGRRGTLRRLGTVAIATAAAPAVMLLRAREWVPIFGRVILAPAPTESARPHASWHGARITAQRRLGRTGAMVSDISFGCTRLEDPKVARLALERGVNYFDTSPDYAATGAEQALGEALRGRRHEAFIATKFCAPNGHLPETSPVSELIEAVEGSLRRLHTDYIDLIQVHSCNRVERLMAPSVHEAYDRLREQGKVRFLGVSSHAPNLAAVARAAIDSGRFDVMMLAYHHGMWPNYADLLIEAQQKDIGIVAMKTLKGAKHAQFPDLGASSYPQAAFRWVLSNPAVSCLVVSMWQERHVDEYLFASGSSITREDVATLQRYDERIAGDYCQPHCGNCRDVCPAGLPIDDLLRARMYALDYGWPGEGMRVFEPWRAALSACIDCPAPCSRVCPQGIAIPGKLADTALRLATST